ncbi:SCO6881 family protein [Actinacidiphila sp. DG2A-62]|uniref:SCO6881 family protein n=1 Tax=Actinacidiphila sp. DG2A-62 TaxID=3108821 RepID=UPI003FA396DE
MAGAVCDAAGAINFVTDPGHAITDGIGAWIAKSAGELAAACADLAADGVDTTTRIDLNAGWFRDNYAMILPIGLVMLVATFCAQLVRAAFKRDGRALAQAFVGTASGVLFAFAAISLTSVALTATDALSDGLFSAGHTSLQAAVRRMVDVTEIAAMSPLGWLVTTFAAFGAAVGAVLFWCVMMVRKVGVLVLVTLAPLAASGGGWEAARRWRRGWIEATATLVASKLLMTIIFLLGISAMGRTQGKDGMAALADCMSGIVIMMLVLLCPYAVFKFVHWASEGTDAETLHRAGGTGATIARQHTERAARKAAMAMAGGAGGAGGAAAGSPRALQRSPGKDPVGSPRSTPLEARHRLRHQDRAVRPPLTACPRRCRRTPPAPPTKPTGSPAPRRRHRPQLGFHTSRPPLPQAAAQRNSVLIPAPRHPHRPRPAPEPDPHTAANSPLYPHRRRDRPCPSSPSRSLCDSPTGRAAGSCSACPCPSCSPPPPSSAC